MYVCTCSTQFRSKRCRNENVDSTREAGKLGQVEFLRSREIQPVKSIITFVKMRRGKQLDPAEIKTLLNLKRRALFRDKTVNKSRKMVVNSLKDLEKDKVVDDHS